MLREARSSRSGMMVTLLDWVILLLLHSADSVGFQVRTTTPRIFVSDRMIGLPLVLPCFIKPNINAENMTVEWSKMDMRNHRIHLYKDGRDHYEEQDLAYRGRTMLFKEELKKGNISLRLRVLRWYDNGIYKCSVTSTRDQGFSTVEVINKAVGSQPVISVMRRREPAGIFLRCETKGWRPKPEMEWYDSKGVQISDVPPDMYIDFDGCYTGTQHVFVQKTNSNRFTCRVQQREINTIVESTIHLSDEVFYQLDPLMVALPVLICIYAVGSAVGVCYLVKHLKQKGRAERGALTKKMDILTEQMDLVTTGACQDYETVRKDAVDVTLDPETAYPKLILSEDGKQVRCGNKGQLLPDNPERFDACLCVLGNKGFSSGRFYYEVQVKNKSDWDLGVARESINRKGDIKLSPRYGIWSISLRDGDEFKGNALPSVVLLLSMKPQKVGVFVDYEEGKVSFYSVEGRTHIYSFTGCTFNEENLYPFFSPGVLSSKNSAPLAICRVDGQSQRQMAVAQW